MDTIKRVQDLMQERDMNLCVCVGKEMRNIVFHDSNNCPSGRSAKRRNHRKNLSGLGNHLKRLLRFLIFVVKSRSPCWKPAQ